MHYSKIYKTSTSEMPGISVTLFVSGCCPNKVGNLNCPGCHNPKAQCFTNGKEYTSETEQELLHALNNPYISGLCLCGGEPYDQDEEVLVNLVKLVKSQFPEKSI